MEDLNRPDARTLILEDVIVPVLPFLPPGDIWNLRAASRRVKEAILDGSPDMFILGERRLPTMMGVRRYWDDVDDMDEDEEDDEDDGGQNKHNVRVYQIQKFRFALSARRSDLADEECKLTSSMIVVEVVLHNGVWEEEDNNRALLWPLPPSTSKTVVAVDIKSIISKRGGEVDENKQRFFEEGGRHDCSTKGRFINDLFISGMDEYTSSLNDPQWVFCQGLTFTFHPGRRTPGSTYSPSLTRFEPQLRLNMAILHECFKRIESFPDETSYPSAGFMMRQLPEPLHCYFPKEFDRERPCRDRNLFVEFEYRRARTLREWSKELLSRFAFKQFLWMEEFDLNGPKSLPWYRDGYDHSRVLDDEEDYDDNDDYNDDSDERTTTTILMKKASTSMMKSTFDDFYYIGQDYY
jgi:hypothetical protein